MSKLINDLVRLSLIPIEDVRAIADWTVIILKDKSNKSHVKISPDTRKP